MFFPSFFLLLLFFLEFVFLEERIQFYSKGLRPKQRRVKKRRRAMRRFSREPSTSHCLVDELFTRIKVALQHQAVVQVGEHGVLQRYPGLLLQRLEGLGVVVLAEVLEAKADGFLLSVLQGHTRRTGKREVQIKYWRAKYLDWESRIRHHSLR